jgi:DNA-binding NtrC family response regulator
MNQILVIDDHSEILSVTGRILERAGYQVFRASGGNEGIDIFRQESVALVITDLKMPHKDGLAVIKELREVDPHARIIAITGYETEALDQARELGAGNCFTKPLHMAKLIGAVEEMLDESKIT